MLSSSAFARSHHHHHRGHHVRQHTYHHTNHHRSTARLHSSSPRWKRIVPAVLFPCVTGTTLLDTHAGALSAYDRSSRDKCRTLILGEYNGTFDSRYYYSRDSSGYDRRGHEQAGYPQRHLRQIRNLLWHVQPTALDAIPCLQKYICLDATGIRFGVVVRSRSGLKKTESHSLLTTSSLGIILMGAVGTVVRNLRLRLLTSVKLVPPVPYASQGSPVVRDIVTTGKVPLHEPKVPDSLPVHRHHRRVLLRSVLYHRRHGRDEPPWS